MDEARAIERFSRSRIAMVLTDPNQDDNPIIYVNRAFEAMTGYSRSAAIGRNCRFLQGENTDPKAVEVLRQAVDNCTDVSVEILNYRADGVAFRNRLTISPIEDNASKCAYFVGLQLALEDDTDGTASNGAEDGDDPEKPPQRDPLDDHLSEIQHRVKNHLSMIVGMIRMQSRSSGDTDGFAALARRIESLQLLYEEMSLSDHMNNRDVIPLGTYLSRIVNSIAHIDGRAGVRVTTEIEAVDANTHDATQLGLVLSEVVTNAFQHAFEGRDVGLLEVRMTNLSSGGIRLVIADDGIGMPEDLTWPKPGSLGGKIMQGLVDSLDGKFDITRGVTGTIITIDVPKITPNDS
ncbi:MAG: PAS domain-containing protein [Celeribacter sp.]|jgi:PAS domain S-box-containing protein